jgi:hypothetical protein
VRGALLAVAAFLSGCATAGPSRLAEKLPAELPDSVTVGGWDKFAGKANMAEASVVYELYVNPIRPALYEITRYRLTTSTTGSDGRTRRQEETEKVLWNPASGSGEPLLAFEWIARRTWRTLWLASTKGEWRRMDPASPDYRSAMKTAINVYVVRNQGTP